jgi:hypothetical protein
VWKLCKALIAVVLLPVCVGETAALWRVLKASGSADTIWVAAAAGAGCWWGIYLLLPKPMWVYVFGHELTHALWAWLFGGRVKAFRARSSGGHVVVTKSNFLIALAPYFFPLYAMLVVAAYLIGNWLWHWSLYVVWFHLLLGAAYAFHITLTWHILKHEQTDITEHGYLFSAVVIYIGNFTFLLIGVPLLTARVSVLDAFQWWFDCSTGFCRMLLRVF